MDNPGEVKAFPRQTMDNEEEILIFTRYVHLVPTAKSLAPESEEDELSSPSEVVDKEFDKMEFPNELYTGFSQLISRLLEKPAKKCGNKQHRKNLYEKEAKQLTDDTGTGSIIKRSRATAHQSRNTENVIHQLIRSDSEASEQIQRKLGTEAEHWAAIEKDAAQWKHQAIQIDQEVAEVEPQNAYLQGKHPEKIQAATLRMRAAKYKLKKIQWLEATGLTCSSPNDPHYAKVLNRGNPIPDVRPALAGQTLAYTINARHMPKPLDKIWHASATLHL